LGDDRSWGGEGEQAMVVSVAGDLVTVADELSDQIGVLPHGAAEYEEGPAVPPFGEHPADGERVPRIGAVVEGQSKASIAGRDRGPRDRPEERQVLQVRTGQVGGGKAEGPSGGDRPATVAAVDQLPCADEPGTDGGAGGDCLLLVHVQAAARRDGDAARCPASWS